ncbi:hypothetical protein SERLA73DRAFT_184103 [Serpula lacrymans var. lacrymans S7.3]|uniref:Methyltransferase type 11 domain-containing protein n=2 Tax=Serpula lacrymans var. lacrymans TaxID=341189 RepID=F8Q2J6_SERL3|nr:uncharacterized protein SERLADRAFT_471603 [Serpula lacrymans var. lacrymans S7.9]EGN97407.1 hypothetical protein SERLA73DRAFT_184103 [Serpula lacrymans var. lacrymans S7.3]EGO22997.1 hypothetical protein SERLADRAFT_471603 [Serpula lacrymans var. lacrymans S7.9]
MKLSASIGLLIDLRFAIQSALWPTLAALWLSPSILLQPTLVSHLFMAHVWTAFGNGVDERARPVKKELITDNAHGVVLDIGAGHGHTINYLQRDKVTRYVAVEPNRHMHGKIKEVAEKAGYSESAGSLIVLACGAEDTTAIMSALGERHTVDTLISVMTLCSVPDPQKTIKGLVEDVLRPGGQMLFYEHVLSRRRDVAWWQRFWTPLWGFAFDGCRLNRPTDIWIERAGGWAEKKVWSKPVEDDEETLFWHRAGRLVKCT